MNKFRKILSSVMAAAIVLSGSVISAGAATKKTFGNAKVVVISCGCQELYDYLKSCGWSCQWAAPAKPGVPADQAPTQPETRPETQPETRPTQPASVSEFNQAYEDEVIALCNAERAKYSLPALLKRDSAVKAAQIRAKEIVQSFSHTRPNGTSCFTVCKQLGISYRSAGENIAYGYRTPAQVVNGWMNSDGHRKNILSASFASIGVGCYRQGGTLYWAQMFLG